MILDCSCTFLCLDAAAWTAVGTIALALLTLFLWRAALRQLDEQRKQFTLLNKAIVYVQSIRTRPVPESEDMEIDVVLKNGGNLTANGRILVVAGSFDRDMLLSQVEHGAEPLVLYPQTDTVKAIPIDDEERTHLTEGNHYYILVRFEYEAIPGERLLYELIARWDAIGDRPIREEESIR